MKKQLRIVFLVVCESDKAIHNICIASIESLKNIDNTMYDIILDMFCVKSKEHEEVYISDFYISNIKNKNYDYIIILRDSICIVERLLIRNIIDIFSTDVDLGVLGIKGYLNLNNEFDDSNIYGGYYYLDKCSKPVSVQYEQPSKLYKEVECITGNFVVFRGDILVRKDVTIEILAEILSAAAIMQGYKVGVPKQEEFWCLETDNNYRRAIENDMRISKEFQIAKYAIKNEKPLLTIGIPTYNRSKYLNKCLNNIYYQVGNLPFIEILVSDNSSTDDTPIVVDNYRKFTNFKYVRQEKNIGAEGNVLYLYENANGKYVIVCGDDDYYQYGTIMRIVETIYDYPYTTAIELAWGGGAYDTYCGEGIDDFVKTCTDIFTCISSVAINHKYYMEIIDRNKFGHTSLNHIYVQLSMLSRHKHYCYLRGGNFLPDSAQAARSDNIGFTLDRRVDFCKIFIDQQYEILNYFLGKGLSVRGLSQEKASNAEKVISWLRFIAAFQERIQWRIDDDMEEIFRRHYSKEPYYHKIVDWLRKIRADDTAWKKEKGLI